MRKAAAAADKPRIVATRVVILLAAATLSAIAGCQVRALWLRLPAVQISRLDREAYDRARRTASGTMSKEARQGLIAANVSSLFTAALRDPAVAAANRDNLERMVTGLHDTQLGRLQLGAFLMHDLEQAGTPVAQWWPALEPVLGGLERAQFPHFLPELTDYWSRVLESAGLTPGTARAEAEEVVAHPHGPFLQYFVHGLRRVAETETATDAPAALRCRQLSWRLLRQWTLDPGPQGLRLLAADLLADDLENASQRGESSAAPSPASAPQPLPGDLRAWRAAVAVSGAPTPRAMTLLSPRFGPVPPVALPRAATLLNGLAETVWFAVAAASAAIVTVAAAASCPRVWLRAPFRIRAGLHGPSAAGFVVSTCFVWLALAPDSLTADLTRFATPELGWPRAPFIAAAVTLGMLAVTLLARARPDEPRPVRRLRLAGAAAGAWLVLSLLLVVPVIGVRVGLGTLDRMRASVSRQSEGVVEATPDSFLKSLRRWDPAGATSPKGQP